MSVCKYYYFPKNIHYYSVFPQIYCFKKLNLCNRYVYNYRYKCTMLLFLVNAVSFLFPCSHIRSKNKSTYEIMCWNFEYPLKNTLGQSICHYYIQFLELLDLKRDLIKFKILPFFSLSALSSFLNSYLVFCITMRKISIFCVC